MLEYPTDQGQVRNPASAASANGQFPDNLLETNDKLADARADANQQADEADISCVRHNPLKNNEADAADEADAGMRACPHSELG